MEPIVEEEEEAPPKIHEENKETENKEKVTSDTQNPTNNNDKNNSDQGIVCDTGMNYKHTYLYATQGQSCQTGFFEWAPRDRNMKVKTGWTSKVSQISGFQNHLPKKI